MRSGVGTGQLITAEDWCGTQHNTVITPSQDLTKTTQGTTEEGKNYLYNNHDN